MVTSFDSKKKKKDSENDVEREREREREIWDQNQRLSFYQQLQPTFENCSGWGNRLGADQKGEKRE